MSCHISTNCGKLSVFQNENTLVFSIKGREIPKENIANLPMIPLNKQLTEKQLQVFLDNHSFQIKNNGVSLNISGKLLGGGQIFVKTQKGKTITLDIKPEEANSSFFETVMAAFNDKEGEQQGDFDLISPVDEKPVDQQITGIQMKNLFKEKNHKFNESCWNLIKKEQKVFQEPQQKHFDKPVSEKSDDESAHKSEHSYVSVNSSYKSSDDDNEESSPYWKPALLIGALALAYFGYTRVYKGVKDKA